MIPVEVSIPDWPYDSLNLILFAEAAAAFEELTLSHGLDQLKVQAPDAWPNYFPPVALPLGRGFCADGPLPPQGCAGDGARLFAGGPVLVPSLRDEMLTITNFTGHPSLTLRAGFVEVAKPAATGRPIRSIHFRSSRRRAGFRTASR